MILKFKGITQPKSTRSVHRKQEETLSDNVYECFGRRQNKIKRKLKTEKMFGPCQVIESNFRTWM